MAVDKGGNILRLHCPQELVLPPEAFLLSPLVDRRLGFLSDGYSFSSFSLFYAGQGVAQLHAHPRNYV